MRKNYILIAIVLLAIFLRFNYDLLIRGYNFDELAIMSIAKQSFPFEIFKTMATIDYHAPLYYLIAHPFTYLNNEWHYLRFLNLLFSILNILVFYKIGTQIKDKKLGYLLALFLTVSHIQITTVSLIKFYCLCFLIFSISIYYLIKVIKFDKGYTKLAITNFFFMLSSTLGFIIVFVEYLLLFLFKKNKKVINSFLISSVGFLLYLPIFLKQYLLNSQTPISPHSTYSEFSLIALINFLNDYFSPLLNYSCNIAPVEAYSYLLNFTQSLIKPPIDIISLIIFIIFSIIPIAFAVIGVTLSIKRNEIFKKINIINFIYLAIFSFLVMLEKTGFIPIYLYPCGLILIISAIYGISEIKNNKTRNFILGYLILIQLIISNVYPPQKRDSNRIKTYYAIEKYISEHDNKNTHFIFTNGARFLKKYYSDLKIIDFDAEKMNGNCSKELIRYLFGEKIKNKINKKNAKELLKNHITQNKRNPEFENYFNKNVVEPIKKNKTLTLGYTTGDIPLIATQKDIEEYIKLPYNSHLAKVSIFPKDDENIKELTPGLLTEIILTYSYSYLFDLIDKNFKIVKIEQYTRTLDDDFIKTFETTNFDKTTKWLAQNTINSWIFITYEKSN